MTTLEYETMLFPVNMLYTLEEFTDFVKSREDGWRQGLMNLLKVCEEKELYEYCSVIKKELDKEWENTPNE